MGDDLTPLTAEADRWIREWVALGFEEMRRYLERHADFDRYLTELELGADR